LETLRLSNPLRAAPCVQLKKKWASGIHQGSLLALVNQASLPSRIRYSVAGVPYGKKIARSKYAERTVNMYELIASCKESAVWGMEHFLKVLSFVPEDKLDWSPSPTAKSARKIAAHTAVYPSAFAKMIRDRRLPLGDEIPAFVAHMADAQNSLTDLAEIEAQFRSGTEELLAAFDGLTPDAVGLILDSGQGWTMPMTFLMRLPGVHAAGHAAQIDYLQTCWGDEQVHF